MKNIRIILASPFLIVGILGIRIGEKISGNKYAHRGSEVLDIYKKNLKCSKCGHVGGKLLDRK